MRSSEEIQLIQRISLNSQTQLIEKNRDNIERLNKFVKTSLWDLVSANQNDELQRYAGRSLIIEYVRFRLDVKELENPGKWYWDKQLRFYFKGGTIIAHACDSEIL